MNDSSLSEGPPIDWDAFDAKSEAMKLLNEADPPCPTTAGPVGTVVVSEPPPVRKNRLWVVERLNLESLSWEPVPMFRATSDGHIPDWHTVFTTRLEARTRCRDLNQMFPAIDSYGNHIPCWRVRCYVGD